MITWKKCLATHEEEQDLSTGPWLGNSFPGIALPSIRALNKWVIIRYGEKWTCALVKDVGPWTVDDEEYVFGDAMPRAQILKGQPCPVKKGTELQATLPDGTLCPKSNGAGIDMFPATAIALGIKIYDNVMVEWAFLDEIWAQINPHV